MSPKASYGDVAWFEMYCVANGFALVESEDAVWEHAII